MFTFYIENHEPFGPLTKNCLKLDKNKSIVSGFSVFVVYKSGVIVRALKEDQPLRLLLNLLFYHFNRSEPTSHKAPRCNCRVQSIKCECSELDIDNNFFLGEISQIVSY